ncbi:hypothetical protein AAH678_09575 [Sodalis endosymbiont of Spalangia cameroni]|uniref:hypothetical protein n=1 Tax=Sodalis praecaptivus TaxID=1239307 RepID=UPI0031F99326
MKPTKPSAPTTPKVGPSSYSKTDKMPSFERTSLSTSNKCCDVVKTGYKPQGDIVHDQVRSIVNSPLPKLNEIYSKKKETLNLWAFILSIFIPTASGNKLAKMTKEQEVFSEGARLMSLAEKHAAELNEKNTLTLPPMSINTLIGYSLGVLRILGPNALNNLTDTALRAPKQVSDTADASVFRPGSSTAIVSASASPPSIRPYPNALFNHQFFSRHTRSVERSLIKQQKSQKTDSPESPPPNQNDVIIVKLFDFDCVNQRKKQGFSDFVRLIGEVLHSPVKKMGEEWQVVYHHEILGKGCPSEKEAEALQHTLNYVDEVTDWLTQLHPLFKPLRVLQHMVGPIMILIANDHDNVPFDMALAQEFHDELIDLARDMFSILPTETKRKLSEKKLERVDEFIPEGVFYENKELLVTVDDMKQRIYSEKNDNYILGMDLWVMTPISRKCVFR